MRELFRRWRRKLGVLTVVLACALTALWMRSLTIRDVFAWKCFNADLAIRSFEGGLGWQRFSPSNDDTAVGWLADSGKKFFSADPWWGYRSFDMAAIGATTKTSRMDFAGFNFGSIEWKTLDDPMGPGGPAKSGTFAVWIIPFWSVVVALALFSWWLLLGGPRPPKAEALA